MPRQASFCAHCTKHSSLEWAPDVKTTSDATQALFWRSMLMAPRFNMRSAETTRAIRKRVKMLSVHVVAIFRRPSAFQTIAKFRYKLTVSLYNYYCSFHICQMIFGENIFITCYFELKLTWYFNVLCNQKLNFSSIGRKLKIRSPIVKIALIWQHHVYRHDVAKMSDFYNGGLRRYSSFLSDPTET